MRKNIIISFVVVSVSLLLCGVASATNLLGDAGFELSGAGPWSWWEDSPPAKFTENFDSTTAVYSGVQSLGISWANVPEYGTSVAYQNLYSITPGQVYRAEVYAKTVGLSGNVLLQTIFRAADWTPTGTITSSSISGDTDWTKLTVSGTVPVGTAFASYRLFTEAYGNSSGSVYFDQGSAAVPEPSTVMLLTTGLGGLFVIARKKRS